MKFLLCLIISTLLFTQTPTLTLKGSKDRLGLKSLDIKVSVFGNLSTTTFDMVFENGYNRILEGQLNFPLSDGQSVSRFAMDVNGKLREGVVVEKEKGRQVFESIERQQVDPGLLEKTKGNNFKTRIYPIPAKGTKRVIIAYEHELSRNNKRLKYFLPLDFEDKIDRFSLNIEVMNQNKKPQFSSSEIKQLFFERWNNSYKASKTINQYKPNSNIEFYIPKTENEHSVFIGKGSHPHFYLDLIPEIHNVKKQVPELIAIFYDVSTSGKKRNQKKELRFLESYLNQLSNVSVQLIPFNIKQQKIMHFNITNGSTAKLIDKIRSLKFDGGTQLGILDFSSIEADEILLFSDGLSNFGKSEIELTNTPVYTINSSKSTDHSYLKFISQKTSGNYINLNNSDIENALNKISNQNYSFLYAEYKKNQLFDIYPSIPTPTQNQFTIAGQMLSRKAKITLHFGFGNTIKFSKTIMLDSKDAIDTYLVQRIWAQKKISELEINYKKNEEKITELGKQFGIVTKNTSLIVLDRLEDYLRYEIVPPDELKDAYNRKIALQRKEVETTKNNRITYAVNLFKKHQQWWENKKVKVKPKPKRNETRVHTERRIISHDTTLSQIAGVIRDKASGEPLPGVQIFIEGTNLGAATDAEGFYAILNVPEGTYTLKINYVGYTDYVVSNIITRSRNTTEYNAELTEATGSSDAVNIVAQRALIRKSETNSRSMRRFKSSKTSQLPVLEDVNEIVNLGSGLTNRENNTINTRGGRGAETTTVTRGDVAGENNDTRIQMKKWDPKTPYLTRLKHSEIDEFYSVYLEEKEIYKNSSSFYLDVADFFSEKNKKETALLILSNIAEMELENHQLMRILAKRLQQLNYNNLAVLLYEEILKIRGEEPQSYRDLGLAYASIGEDQKAIDILYEVIIKKWDGRFPEIELIILNEINNIISQSSHNLNLAAIDKRLINNLPLDIRVVLEWDADNTDIDLWVIDPNGEKCYFSNRNTAIRGRISRDFTGGYGPEVFMLKSAIKGKYKIKANYYGNRQQIIAGATTVQLKMITDYGKKTEKTEEVTLRLKNQKEVVDVGTFQF